MQGMAMKGLKFTLLCGLALLAVPSSAQDEGVGEEVIVTAMKRSSLPGPTAAVERRPVIGLKRQADSAVRAIEIISDSREEDMRQREVQAMLLAAIDRAKREGFSLVTGQYELVEVTRANWQDQFPALVRKPSAKDEDEDEEEEDDDDDDEDDDEEEVLAAFEDDGSTATVRLKVKTKLDGSIGNAQQKIRAFVKSVPATGRSQINQKGGLALTIINPEQYRDEIYKRIAVGAKHAASFYGPDYGLKLDGLDRAIAWAQVSNTEVFLYIPYDFSVGK
jgi:hypothetical protein